MKSIIALYKFNTIKKPLQIREALLALGKNYDITGTILVAHEGINGTVSVASSQHQSFIVDLKHICGVDDISYKISTHEDHPFHRFKVKHKKEIVTIGCDVNPAEQSGEYVEPENWNELISQDDVLLIDTRNEYEYAIGTFRNAINPHTDNFREFPAYVQKQLAHNKRQRVAMFCTGGIRCEKASSYMLGEDFEKVYHLKGGILKYLEVIPEKDSLWDGECFVFDQRIAVKHRLKPGSYDQCHACRWPITNQDKQSIYYKEGESCHQCHMRITPAKQQKFRERQKQTLLAKQRGKKHIGQIIN